MTFKEYINESYDTQDPNGKSVNFEKYAKAWNVSQRLKPNLNYLSEIGCTIEDNNNDTIITNGSKKITLKYDTKSSGIVGINDTNFNQQLPPSKDQWETFMKDFLGDKYTTKTLTNENKMITFADYLTETKMGIKLGELRGFLDRQESSPKYDIIRTVNGVIVSVNNQEFFINKGESFHKGPNNFKIRYEKTDGELVSKRVQAFEIEQHLLDFLALHIQNNIVESLKENDLKVVLDKIIDDLSVAKITYKLSKEGKTVIVNFKSKGEELDVHVEETSRGFELDAHGEYGEKTFKNVAHLESAFTEILTEYFIEPRKK